MDLQTRKLNLISYLTQTQDERLLEKLEKFILKREKKQEFKPFSQEELINRIKASELDYEMGNFKTQEEFEKLSSEW